MKALAHRSFPRNLVPRRNWPLAPKQIDAQHIPRRGWTSIDCRIGNFHCSIPDVTSLVDSRRNREARIPFPASAFVRMIEINIKIDPFPLRRDLEFFVTPNVIEVGTDKSLCH